MLRFAANRNSIGCWHPRTLCPVNTTRQSNPLIKLFQSRQSSENEKAAAAYGLCGVYAKTGNTTARIRFALWLHAGYRNQASQLDYPTDIKDQSIYWAASGWDLNNLLETETTSA